MVDPDAVALAETADVPPWLTLQVGFPTTADAAANLRVRDPFPPLGQVTVSFGEAAEIAHVPLAVRAEVAVPVLPCVCHTPDEVGFVWGATAADADAGAAASTAPTTPSKTIRRTIGSTLQRGGHSHDRGAAPSHQPPSG